jgi:hypothetical protein
VPERAALLIRPLLDLRQEAVNQCGLQDEKCRDGEAYERQQQRWRKVGGLLYRLTRRRSADADEALVVLMCFYIGESQEERDAVITRGRRMLPLLRKYLHGVPVVPGREYSTLLLKPEEIKTAEFAGAMKAIEKRGAKN